MQPTISTSATIMGSSHVENKLLTCISLPASWLNRGRMSIDTNTANTNEKKLSKTDSVRNCVMRSERVDPATFRMPTSLARFADRAVDRFMKFTHAIIKIKAAITE